MSLFISKAGSELSFRTQKGSRGQDRSILRHGRQSCPTDLSLHRPDGSDFGLSSDAQFPNGKRDIRISALAGMMIQTSLEIYYVISSRGTCFRRLWKLETRDALFNSQSGQRD